MYSVLWTGIGPARVPPTRQSAAFEGDAVLLSSSIAVRTLLARVASQSVYVRMSVAFQAMVMTYPPLL